MKKTKEFVTSKLEAKIAEIFKSQDTTGKEGVHTVNLQAESLAEEEIKSQGLTGYALCSAGVDHLHMSVWIKEGNNAICYAVNASKDKKPK